MSRESMRRLPEKCWAMIDGESCCIHRGGAAVPIHTGSLGVMTQNQARGISDAQRMAMIAGVVFGWDHPSADPNAHSAEPMPKFTMRVEIPITATVEVSAYSVDDAIEQATIKIDNLELPENFERDGSPDVVEITKEH